MRTLTSIEEMDISWNMELKSLPDWIGELKSLKKLDVSQCGLTHLPHRYINIMISLFSIIVFTSVSLLLALDAILDQLLVLLIQYWLQLACLKPSNNMIIGYDIN